LLQAISTTSPTYPILHQSGPEHNKRFVAQIRWQGLHLGLGEGRSKKEAEISAARDALEKRVWLEYVSPESDDSKKDGTSQQELQQHENPE